jgi:hypothetical protein
MLYCSSARATIVLVDRSDGNDVGISRAVYRRLGDHSYTRVFPRRPSSDLLVRDMVQHPETPTDLSVHRLAEVNTAMNWEGIFALDCATGRARRLLSRAAISFDQPGHGHVSRLVGIEPAERSLLVEVGFVPDGEPTGRAMPYWIARLRLQEARAELLQRLEGTFR